MLSNKRLNQMRRSHKLLTRAAASGHFRMRKGRVETNRKYVNYHVGFIRSPWRVCDFICDNRYLKFTFEGVNLSAHRFAYVLYHGSITFDLQINHKDGDGLNNVRRNIELLTQTDNMRHGYLMGLIPPTPAQKLTAAKVRRIRKTVACGSHTQSHWAREYAVSKQTISSVVSRRIWKHVA